MCREEGMETVLKHPLERKRIEALRSLQLLETGREKEFDEITLLASQISGKEFCMFGLMEENHLRFKSCWGFQSMEMPREYSFCNQTILQEGLFVISDASQDERFRQNPFVISGPQVRFYAGLPIRDPETLLPIGTLCVLDTKPGFLNESQVEGLKALRTQIE